MSIDANEMNRRLVGLAESRDVRFWRVDYSQLSAPEQVFLVIWELEAEVNNGGFEQYFSNSSGRLAPHAGGALRAIGAEAMAAIVDQAFSAVDHGVSWSNDEARKATLIALKSETLQKLEGLDEAFRAYPNNLNDLLYRFVSAHRGEIGAPADF
jgi:hypothetical protein